MSIRNIDSLQAAIDSGMRPKWLFFWGHQPSPNGTISKTCLSQWWEGAEFQVGGVAYPTAEHYMMAEKARLFGDDEIAAQILSATHPGQAKRLGRKVKNFDEQRWRQQRFDIVVKGSVAKFGQNPDLGKFLKSTGERVLVEASPRDRIWGIGMGASNSDAETPSKWKGLNLLGFALMEARTQLFNP